MEIILANLGKPRRERLHGRDFLVAPATLIVSGVLNGSQGPGYYPLDELHAQDWNGMPLVVWHPQDKDGNHTSARDPKILAEYGVGNLYNADDQDKLGAEAWFDVALTRNADQRFRDRPGYQPILPKLEAGLPIELSTGLQPSYDLTPGVYNGTSYSWVARGIKPDHVAILPDQKGACSVKDGCGVNNHAGLFKRLMSAVANALGIAATDKPDPSVAGAPPTCNKCGAAMDGDKCSACGLTLAEVPGPAPAANQQDWLDQLTTPTRTTNTQKGITMTAKKFDRAKATKALAANCACNGDKEKQALNLALQELTDGQLKGLTSVVNSMRTINRQRHIVTNAEGDAPEGVDIAKLAKFLAVESAPASDPVAFVAELKGKLEAVLAKLEAASPAPEEPAPEAPPTEPVAMADDGIGTDPELEPKPEPVANVGKAVKAYLTGLTKEQWLAHAPAEVRAVINSGSDVINNERQRLINYLTANIDEAPRKMLQTRLANKGLDELRDLAHLRGPAANRQQPASSTGGDWFFGKDSGQAPVLNQGGQGQPDAEEQAAIEAMTPPVLNFRAERDAARKIG